ncbi:serine/threonine protein kinase [Planotetraspora thailandica]|uniref:non-specific serine/threonine protein kinase n=1 Tax=Planotetraspora thailandica TaxID=487172 RepID=A0A8J3XT03_9ACTN|nr:class III lanthionine synthetase LanKC [Planotetraspora thailandica]GII51724.1 serine/threonine protein kinase [Planotetraspora thailandica]
MINAYEIYCLADPFFYDSLERKRAEHPDFAIAGTPVPEGWDHVATDTWLHYAPPGVRLPQQGWKIHVSSRAEQTDQVLAAVWDYCVAHSLAFKFLRGRRVMVSRNSKYAGRGSSGKLVTVYPVDDAQLELVLKELSGILQGVAGPYILSDLRYGDGPLYVRYGGFAERHCVSESGERVLAIENDRGELVPDVRGPAFSLPAWVRLPEFLEPHLAARGAVTIDGLPYAVDGVLHFSNGGGVYLGHDVRTGEKVVLKEARPHAGLDAAGRDAVTRLRHEAAAMERLAGLDAVPALLDHVTVGEHHFLVMEHVDGTALSRLVAQKHPLTRADHTDEMLADYTRWAAGMLEGVRRAVASLHERGVVFGDLHPFNVLVDGDRVVLIDFEVASPVEERRRPTLADPGFVPPPDRLGVEADEYALACLHLGMFAPMATMMLPLHRPKVVQLGRLIEETFPVPPGLIGGAVRTILGHEPPRPVEQPPASALAASWPAIRESVTVAILASATPERDDRLFPGDIVQFQPGGGVSLANGAAGVLHALRAAGAGRFPEHEDWLVAHAADPEAGIGFYNGSLGVAWALDGLGRRDDALDVLERSRPRDRAGWERLDLSLYQGIAGVALTLLHFHDVTGDATLLEQALLMAESAAGRLGGPGDVPEISGGVHPHAGLMYGSAGVALMFLHVYERTGDDRLLDVAATALRQDLRRCVRRDDGQLQVQQGWRTNPYLDEGSAGIGLVLARFLAHRNDEAFREFLDAIRPVGTLPYFIQPGLFAGRAGMIACLGADPVHDRTEAAAQVARLAWHELPYRDGLAFPGAQLLRLSMDLATGSAGVLLALGTVLHDQPVHLPFFEPPGWLRAQGPLREPAGCTIPTSSGRRCS